MALQGNLHDLALADLIQLFRMSAKTGMLLLVGGAERGVVYVCEGRLVDAVLVRGPERQVLATADEAVVRLLGWEDATFTFQDDPQVRQRPARMAHDREWLVGAGRHPENLARRPSQEQITLDTRLALSSRPGVAGAIELDLEQWRLLCQAALRQSVREICARMGMEPEQAIGRLAALVAYGLLEIV
jgi:hypothetical protein